MKGYLLTPNISENRAKAIWLEHVAIKNAVPTHPILTTTGLVKNLETNEHIHVTCLRNPIPR